MMKLRDLFANRKPDPCSWKLVATMQAFKQTKNLFTVLWIETDAIVANSYGYMIVLLLGEDVDHGINVGSCVLQRVRDQVNE